MNKATVSNVLPANAVKKAMPACLIYNLVMNMTFLVDAIIAGHSLGTDAVTSIALGLPMIGLMISFTAMVMKGAMLKLINAMGRNNMEDYHRLVSISLIFMVIADCLFVAICLFATNACIAISGADKAAPLIVEMALLYVRAACLEILFFCVGSLFQIVLATYGYQIESMICSVLCVLVNIVASVLLVEALPDRYAIAGLGIGSAIGAFAQLSASMYFMHKRDIHLRIRLYPLNKQNFIDSLDMMRRGFPTSADAILSSVCLSVVNNIVLTIFVDGEEVLALLTIIHTIGTGVKIAGGAASSASEPLIGILYGAKDNEGIKRTFITALQQGMIYAAGIAVLVIAFKSPLLAFYNEQGNPDAHVGMILTAVSSLVMVVNCTLSSTYNASDHIGLAMVVSIIPDSILYPALVALLGRSMGVTGVWLALGYNFIPFFMVYYLFLAIRYRTLSVPLSKLLFLKDYEDRIVELDVSIPADADNVTYVSSQMQSFLLDNGASPKLAYKAALCTEEIAADYIDHKRNQPKKYQSKKKQLKKNQSKKHDEAGMDIKVIREEDQIEITIRNYDDPYNPLIFEVQDEEYSKIGVTMVQKISREVKHSYAYHLNIISIIMNVS